VPRRAKRTGQREHRLEVASSRRGGEQDAHLRRWAAAHP